MRLSLNSRFVENKAILNLE